MDNKIYLVAMAAGRGTRMASKTPKQFIMFNGKPVLQNTIEKFLVACPGIKVVTVLPQDCIPMWKDLCLGNNFIYPQLLVSGGITRFHSVRNALEKVPDGAIVAIHDGVRPLVSADMIRKMLDRMSSDSKCRALIPVTPSTDTLVLLDSCKTTSGEAVLTKKKGCGIDRSEVFAVQTPQIFRSEDIKAAYRELAYSTDFTDDSSVADKYKIPLTFCAGERLNIKLTTPEDLLMADALISAGICKI